jgi:dethiobiotin synthetase
LGTILEGFARLRCAHDQIVVEGIGGWRVPISRSFFVSDLAFEMGLPIVVVVANRLGALNHAILTVEAVQARGLACAGVILNEIASASEEPDVAVTTNPSVLGELLNVPILGHVPHGAF